VRWNFDKFLIDHEGKVIGRFEPAENPTGEKIKTALETALAKAPKPERDAKVDPEAEAAAKAPEDGGDAKRSENPNVAPPRVEGEREGGSADDRS